MIEIRHALTNDDGETLVLLLELCDQYLAVFANEMINQVMLTKMTDEMLERLESQLSDTIAFVATYISSADDMQKTSFHPCLKVVSFFLKSKVDRK